MEVLDGMQSLAGSGLLREREGAAGEGRFSMPEAVHEYAAERLEESGEGEAMRRRHALYLMEFAEEAEPQIRGPQPKLWLGRVEEEHDNMRAALSWVREASGTERGPAEGELEPVDIGLRIVGALDRFWVYRGYYSEGGEQLTSILALKAAGEGPGARKALRARALLGEALVTVRLGKGAVGAERVAEALAIYRELGDRLGEAKAALMVRDEEEGVSQSERLSKLVAVFQEVGDHWYTGNALRLLGETEYVEGRLSSAIEHLNAALALSERMGYVGQAATVLQNLAFAEILTGDYGSVRAHRERSLGLFREVGEKWGIAVALHNVVDVIAISENFSGLRSLSEESVAVAQEAGLPLQEAVSLLDLGRMALLESDYAGAHRRFEASRQVARRYLDQPTWSTLYEAYLAEREGDSTRAAQLYRETLVARGMTGKEPDQLSEGKFRALAMAGLGGIDGDEPSPEEGARLLGAAHALIEATGWPLHYDERIEYRRSLDTARGRIADEATWQRSWAEGEAMSAQQAIDYALQV